MNTIRILFSKALILTYVFIGYLSLVDYDSPTCTVDSVPECSNNDLAYPTVQTFHVSMNEHIRSFKPASVHHDQGVIAEFCWDAKPTLWISLNSAYSSPPLIIVYSDHQSRAPPAFIL